MPSDEKPMIVVLGPYRSGTSCVAGVLWNLGVHMGRKQHVISGSQALTFEDKALQTILSVCLKEPGAPEVAIDDLELALGRWARRHRDDGGLQEKRCGAKHPLLCSVIPILARQFAPVIAVSVERPLEESIVSLQLQDWWGMSPRAYASPQQQIFDHRQRHLHEIDHITLAYQDLLDAPEETITRLAQNLGLETTDAQLQAAINSVERRAIGRQPGGTI